MDPDRLEQYAEGWRRRARRDDEVRHREMERARRAASRVAEELRSTYGARRIWLVGSLARGTWSPRRSDVDLVVEGLEESRHLRALAAVARLCPWPVDLVRVEDKPSSWRDTLELDGRELP